MTARIYYTFCCYAQNTDKTHSLAQERSLLSNLHRITGRWKAINTRVMSVGVRPGPQRLHSRSRGKGGKERRWRMCVCLGIIKPACGAGCLTRGRAAADGVMGCGCVGVEGQPCDSNSVPGRAEDSVAGRRSHSHRDCNPVYRCTCIWLKFIN